MKYTIQELGKIHDACGWHESAIKNSKQCGCFYCITFFSPEDITEWIDEPKACPRGPGKTAICPNCGIDSVLPDSLHYKLDRELLEAMNIEFFQQ